MIKNKIFLYALLFWFLITLISIHAMELTENLTAYFPMNETSGNIVDIKNGFVGTQSGTIISGTGIIETSRNFSGNSNYFTTNITASIVSGNSLTYNVWYKGSTLDFVENGGIITLRDGAVYPAMMYASDSSGPPNYYITGMESGDQSFMSLILDYSWNMYSSVFNDSDNTMTLYRNGILQSVGNQTSSISAGTVKIYIGTEGYSLNSRSINGLIDEVGIWSRALSQTEITALYNGGSGLAYPLIIPDSFNISFTENTTLNNTTFYGENSSVIMEYQLNFSNTSKLLNATIFLYNTSELIETAINNTTWFRWTNFNLGNGTYYFNATAYINDTYSISTETRIFYVEINETIIPVINDTTSTTDLLIIETAIENLTGIIIIILGLLLIILYKLFDKEN